MIKVKEAIIVEGKYDKIKLSNFIDGLIIDVDGFGLFKNKEKIEMIRKVANKDGVIVLTDSDSAGFIIRNYLNNIIPKDKIKHAYVPDIYGKEKRKIKTSCEGKLGVEGLSEEIILKALKDAKSTVLEANENKRIITTTDLYRVGLSGREDSKIKRRKLTQKLGLPEHISQKALINVMNRVINYDEYLNLVKDL